jgi:hypothetical protein
MRDDLKFLPEFRHHVPPSTPRGRGGREGGLDVRKRRVGGPDAAVLPSCAPAGRARQSTHARLAPRPSGSRSALLVPCAGQVSDLPAGDPRTHSAAPRRTLHESFGMHACLSSAQVTRGGMGTLCHA